MLAVQEVGQPEALNDLVDRLGGSWSVVLSEHPDARGISRIVEHWLPWQGDSATTTALEQRWTEHTLSHLRSTP